MNWLSILAAFSLLHLHLVSGERASSCGSHEHDLDGVRCCRKCPPGFGVTSECSEDQDTNCELCTHGENFSSSHSHEEQCQTCSECDLNAHIMHPCNVTHDTECECNQDFYWDGDSCKQCDLCPHGSGASRPCTSQANTVCRKCPAGTYSGVLSSTLGCIVCSVCREEQILLQECTPIQDTLCIDKEFPRLHRSKSTARPATDGIRGPVPGPSDEQSTVIPVYCAILGAVVLGLLAYVVFKQWRNKNGSSIGSGTGIKLSGGSGGNSHGDSVTVALTAEEDSPKKPGHATRVLGILPNERKVMDMKIQDIPSSKRREMESFLNLRRSDQRDWRGLARELGFSHSKIAQFEKKGKEKHGPTRHILSELGKHDSISVGRIVNALQTLGRFDVIRILVPSIEKTSPYYKPGELV